MKLKKYLKEHPSYWWKVPGVILLLVIVSCSVKIDTVDQPASVNGGDILPVTLNCHIVANDPRTTKWMVAVLVPKVWKAAQNTTITFTSKKTTGDQAMTLIPAGTSAPQGNGLDWPTLLVNRIGNGGNKLNDYEWVAFYSNLAYNIVNGDDFDITVSIKIKTSEDNLSFKLGYCVAESSDGLSDPQYFSYNFPSQCFEVHGTGDLIDFCNAQVAVIDPRTSLDNDIITVSYDAGLLAPPLSDIPEVYLCAKGYTTDGDSVSVCEQTARTKLDALGLNRWRKDLWPRGFFKLSDNRHLSKMSYYFTDVTGTVKVGYAGGADPFTYTFKCL
jgi:hypothetical protein